MEGGAETDSDSARGSWNFAGDGLTVKGGNLGSSLLFGE
jgi:hypothetical protein